MASDKKKSSRILSGVTGPVHQDGDIHFSQPDLFQFMYRTQVVESLRLKISQLESHAAQLRAENVVRVLQVMEEREAVVNEMNIKLGDLGTLKREIESVYEITLDGLLYDDQTGKITLPSDPKEEK